MKTISKERTVRLTHNPLALVIHETKNGRVQVDAYFLTPVAGGYRLSKTDGIRYVVCLDGSAAPCTCPGHQHWGHKTVCKHVAALKKLIAEGKLAEPVCSVCHGRGGPATGDLDSDGAACRACGE